MYTTTATRKQLGRKILLGSILFMIISCNQNKMVSPALADLTKNDEKQKEAIKNTLKKMWQAIEAEDIDTYASYIHRDFTQFGETDSILRIGKETEIKNVKAWLKNASDIHTEMIDPIVTIHKNVAWIVYYWSDSGLTDGKPFASKGKSTRIFIKENDQWLCMHGHYTLIP